MDKKPSLDILKHEGNKYIEHYKKWDSNIWKPNPPQSPYDWTKPYIKKRDDVCEHCGSMLGVLTTKSGKKLCAVCAGIENTELKDLQLQASALRAEVRKIQKQIKDLTKKRDALKKEVGALQVEVSAKEAKEGAVGILEDMRDITSAS